MIWLLWLAVSLFLINNSLELNKNEMIKRSLLIVMDGRWHYDVTRLETRLIEAGISAFAAFAAFAAFTAFTAFAVFAVCIFYACSRS
jgi:hypothetical protein